MKWKYVLLSLGAVMPLCAYTSLARQSEHPTKNNTSLVLVENKGQVRDQYRQARSDIQYKLSAGNGLNIFLGTGKLQYVWSKALVAAETVPSFEEGYLPQPVQEVDFYRVDVELLGASPNARVLTAGKQGYYERYFQPWVNATNSNNGVVAAAYRKITYQEVYPHIDWVFYINEQGQLEHDFVVHPGGRVADIRIQYKGASQLQLHPDGSLGIQSPLGHVSERAPYSYDQQGRDVPSRFVLQDSVLSFAVAKYEGTLTIDPVLEWGTYLGGDGSEECFALGTDKWGHVYMSGSASSTDNIATTGAHQTAFGLGTNDAFICKWDKEGHLLWSSYYGGSSIDVAKGISCDTMGYVYMGGYTNSATGIATTASFQSEKKGLASTYDAFVVKFDSSGIRQWGTYFGGANNEGQTSFTLTTSGSGKVYLAGNTQSTDLATTAGVHQPAKNGGIDAFLASLDSSGGLLWSTFYGGPGTDDANAIAVDSDNFIYLAGNTRSITDMATAGAYQTTHGGGTLDAYLGKFDNKGQLIWATYAGGSGSDEGTAVAIAAQKVVLAGFTGSAHAIATNNAHQATFGGGASDAYLMQFSPDGLLLWGTYYGGDNVDGARGLITTANGTIYMAGRSGSAAQIATDKAVQSLYGGLVDAFITKWNNEGTLLWGSYYGGTSPDYANAIAVDAFDHVHMGGATSSGAGIASDGAYQPLLKGGRDAFLVRLNDCNVPDSLSEITGNREICADELARYSVPPDSLASIYVWLLPSGWAGSSDSSSIEVKVSSGNGIIQVYAQSACGGRSDTQSLAVKVWSLPLPQIQYKDGILTATKAYANYQWYLNGQIIEGADSAVLIPAADGVYSLSVLDENGCTAVSDSVVVQYLAIKKKSIASNLLVYPNPVQRTLYIQSGSGGTLHIVDLDGKPVTAQCKLMPGTNRVDVGALPAGMYLLRYQSKEGWTEIKIIKL